jgi:two-component system, chemotaxis family, protein-glutamate methylesterase/glutaminase
MSRLRVLVVEDSLTVRRRLCEVLAGDREIEVVGEAADGRQAIEACRTLRPDVITMDMMLPLMTGLAATEYIMAHFPTPILVVSASFNRGEVFRTFDALAAGAVDVLEKPTGEEADGDWERRLLSSVKMAARIRVITHIRARMNGRAPTALATNRPWCQCVAIGASTGGPGAIVEVLRALPTPMRVPVLVVLHINEPFGTAFADWLDGQTSHRVSFAVDMEPLAGAAGRVLMAPPGRHLMLQHGLLRLTNGAERHSCRPSVDTLFESLAAEQGAGTAACLLTGMGRDGAAGLLAIRRAGGLTIAQDEATCVVYGMPREAAQMGAAERVLPLGEIGPALAAVTMPDREAFQ